MKERTRCLVFVAVGSIVGFLIGPASRNGIVNLMAAGRSRAQAASPENTSPGVPAKHALLVGINNYKYPTRISPLAGSINDVEDMKSVLIGKFDFPPENVLVLKDGQATHAAII